MITIALIVCIFAFFMTICDFLALHDIRSEYVSTHILEDLNITLSEELPDWTATKGEWGVVRVSYISRFIFFILNIGVLLMCFNRMKNKG